MNEPTNGDIHLTTQMTYFINIDRSVYGPCLSVSVWLHSLARLIFYKASLYDTFVNTSIV